jgi:hypothetical protein
MCKQARPSEGLGSVALEDGVLHEGYKLVADIES